MSLRDLTCLTVLAVSTACTTAAPGTAGIRLSPDVQVFVPLALAEGAGRAHRPWAVLDKKDARLYLFDESGKLRASSPVLLGAAIGDDSAPGIGDRKIAEIRPFEKTTPAGRFRTEPGTNLQGEDVVWIDYDAAISMHRVRPLKGERRLKRLASPSPGDNRISYGCVNVPAAFYDRWIKPAFGVREGVLYVLPETRSAQVQFSGLAPVVAPRP